MSNYKTPSTTDNDDVILFNISEAEKKQPFYDLDSYVRQFAPEYQSIMDNLLRGEDVDTKDINKIMRILVEVVMPYYNTKPDGGIADPEMAHLDETMYQVGRQL